MKWNRLQYGDKVHFQDKRGNWVNGHCTGINVKIDDKSNYPKDVPLIKVKKGWAKK